MHGKKLHLKLMRIYLDEADKHEHRPLYTAILDLCRAHRVMGATVFKAAAGFANSGEQHSDRLLRLSIDLPVVVEVVDREDKIAELLPALDEMLAGGGLITLESLTAIRYAGHSAGDPAPEGE
jgi:PII-like signaling protein